MSFSSEELEQTVQGRSSRERDGVSEGLHFHVENHRYSSRLYSCVNERHLTYWIASYRSLV